LQGGVGIVGGILLAEAVAAGYPPVRQWKW
jgi:hypothetical protein